MLRAQELGRSFGDRWVFRGINLALEKGQCLCVLGPNGTGKSTLLKVLAGLMAPTEGAVTRPGRNGIGYAALDLALYPQLSAPEHLALFAKLRNVPDPGVKLLDSLGLPGVGSKPSGAFSTGMRARLKLALATMHLPEVLFLDEPTAALDDKGQALIGQTIQGQLERGAVIIATNDPADRSYATHELVLAG